MPKDATLIGKRVLDSERIQLGYVTDVHEVSVKKGDPKRTIVEISLTNGNIESLLKLPELEQRLKYHLSNFRSWSDERLNQEIAHRYGQYTLNHNRTSGLVKLAYEQGLERHTYVPYLQGRVATLAEIPIKQMLDPHRNDLYLNQTKGELIFRETDFAQYKVKTFLGLITSEVAYSSQPQTYFGAYFSSGMVWHPTMEFQVRIGSENLRAIAEGISINLTQGDHIQIAGNIKYPKLKVETIIKLRELQPLSNKEEKQY